MTLVLLNPNAQGGRAGRLAGPLREWLARHAPQARLVVPTDAAAARQAIEREPAGSRIVVVGGDGSLHQLLGALHARTSVVGLVGAGSGDDSARALGLRGWRWPRALAHALSAPARPIDLGEVRTASETRLFVSSLAAGFDAAVAERALAAPGALAGLARYLLATLCEVAALRLFDMRVWADAALIHDGPALFASALNTPTYGGGMPAVPAARVDDGRLELLLAGRFSRIGALAMLPRLLAGRHLGHPRVQTRGFTTLRLECATPLPLAADGERMAPARWAELRVHTAALQVVSAAC